MTAAPSKEEIAKLEDVDLVRTAGEVYASPVFEHLTSLDAFERKFLRDIPNVYVEYGTITWRQRRTLRNTLYNVAAELERRAKVLPRPDAKPKNLARTISDLVDPPKKRGRPRKVVSDG